MSSLTSNSMRMMEKSMQYLWTKEAAHMDNIANAETPGYRVKTVRFEETFANKLRAASRYGHGTRKEIRKVIEGSTWKVDEDDEVTRMDGNGVNVTEQMVELVRTTYQMQTLYRTISSDLKTLNGAISG